MASEPATRSPRFAPVREVLYFAAFLVVAIVLTWPLATQMSTIVSDTGDPLLNTWIIDWDCYSLTHREARLFQANIFYPDKYPLAYSENMIGVALVMLPSYLAGASPLTTYNLAMLLGFAFSAYGGFVFGRKATGSAVAGVVAGLLYGFVPFRFDHLAHVQIVWGGWLPLVFAAFLHFRDRPSIARAALLCGALVMNGLTNIHWLLFGFFGLSAAIVLVAIARWTPAGEGRAFWTRLLISIGISIVILYPVLRPYRIVSKMYDMHRGASEVRDYSAVWTDWLVTTDRSALYGRLPGPGVAHGERRLFPGLVALLLGAFAMVSVRRKTTETPIAHRAAPGAVLHSIDALIVIALALAYAAAVSDRFVLSLGSKAISLSSAANPTMYALLLIVARFALALPSAIARFPGENLRDRLRSSRLPPGLWIAFLLIVIGVLGSFGMNAFFHTFLFEHVSAFRSVRAVARWAMLAYVGFAIASAYTVAAFLERMTPNRARVLAMFFIVAAVNDVRTNIVWDHAIPAIPPVTRWIAETNIAQPIVELPIEQGSAQYYYLLWATAHHKLVMNGTSGFEPPVHARLHELANADAISDAFTNVLIRNHCAFVVMHNDCLAEQTPKYLRWLQRELQHGRLAFVRRFDHAAEGDWVFAVVPVVHDWQRFRIPETRDAAGFTPAQNLDRMLAGEATYNNATFGTLDACGADAGAPFHIAGWALSPNGVREVIARMECGKVQVPLARVPRGDVNARWPWYPEANAGFSASFDRRPKGVRRHTDVQIEIVDGRGRRTSLPAKIVDW